MMKRLSMMAMIGGLLAAPVSAQTAKVEAEGLLSCGGPAAGAAPTAFVEYMQSGVVQNEHGAGTESRACYVAMNDAIQAAADRCRRADRDFDWSECYGCYETPAGEPDAVWYCTVRWWCE